MSELPDRCDPSTACPAGASADACCGDTPACSSRITVAEARARFEREAVAAECDTGRYRCRYYSWGRGPALIMVPGLAETAGSFLLTCARLSSHFRCIAYELPNGRDDAAVLRRYRHADLVADLFALLDHLGIEQSYILGTSFGSTIALGALHAQPRRLLRGVLVGGFARRRLAPAERLLVALAGRWPGNMGLLPLRRTILRRTHGPAFAAREPACWDYFVSQSNSSAIRAVVQRALLMHHVDLRPLLGEIRQPILMVCGDADPLVGRDREEDLLRGLPNVVRVEFEHCGHFPQYTHPELLADVVRGFLTPLGCKEEKAHGPQSVGLE